MEKLIFREEQPMRKSILPWLIVPAWLFVVVIFAFGFYTQLYKGIPFGNQPMSNTGLLWSGILVIILLGGFFTLLMSSCLLTEVWTDGIRFRFPPFVRNIKHIPLSEMVSADVTKYRPIAEFGGWGWRKRILLRKTAYNISGNIGVRIIKKNGSLLVLGTQKKDEMKQAVDKMMQRDKDKLAM